MNMANIATVLAEGTAAVSAVPPASSVAQVTVHSKKDLRDLLLVSSSVSIPLAGIKGSVFLSFGEMYHFGSLSTLMYVLLWNIKLIRRIGQLKFFFAIS